MSDPVTTTRDDATLTITIARESRRNALNADVATAIMAALDRAESDGGIRAVVLTGAGERAFAPAATCSRRRTARPSASTPPTPATTWPRCCAG